MDRLISLIHPSRQRAKKSWNTTRRWIESAGCETELIVSIDESDPERELYLTQYAGQVIINPNTCVVEAANHAARKAKGDILVYLSDDFDCPNNWGTLIKSHTQGLDKWLLKVDDCLQRFEAEVLTIPIMSRSLYDNLGYFFHPDYKSMWVDVDLYFTCLNMRAIVKAPNLKFPHEHYCNGKAPRDETYNRSDQHFKTGKEIYNMRLQQNFPK